MRKYYYQDFHLNPYMEALVEDFLDKMRGYFEKIKIHNKKDINYLI